MHNRSQERDRRHIGVLVVWQLMHEATPMPRPFLMATTSFNFHHSTSWAALQIGNGFFFPFLKSTLVLTKAWKKELIASCPAHAIDLAAAGTKALKSWIVATTPLLSFAQPEGSWSIFKSYFSWPAHNVEKKQREPINATRRKQTNEMWLTKSSHWLSKPSC